MKSTPKIIIITITMITIITTITITMITRTNKVESIVEVRHKFFTEVIIDWNPHEVGILNKLRLRTRHTHVQLIKDVVTLQV